MHRTRKQPPIPPGVTLCPTCGSTRTYWYWQTWLGTGQLTRHLGCRNCGHRGHEIDLTNAPYDEPGPSEPCNPDGIMEDT